MVFPLAKGFKRAEDTEWVGARPGCLLGRKLLQLIKDEVMRWLELLLSGMHG